MTKPLFITFEGIDGSGKTTLAKHVEELLKKHNLKTVLTREPGGTKLGKSIRQILATHNNLDPWAEFLLFLADREQHIEEIVEPALNEGSIVLCDRFIDSTIVYQHYLNGLSKKKIIKFHDELLINLKPDITFYLYLPVEKAIERLSGNRVDTIDKYDKKETLTKVANAYVKWYAWLKMYSNRNIIFLNAEKSILELGIEAVLKIRELLRK